MTMGDQVTVTMTGGGPYGFRLFGGDNIPLSVAKIRRRSKAADAGLIEGDILLGINGYSCRGVNHSTAMSLAESSGDMLVFQVLRGADDQQSVEAAFRSLGDQLSSISPSALQPSAAPSAGRPMINSNVTPASQYQRQEYTTQDADTTTRVTTEMRTDTLGDTSYRQTTTQRLTTTNYGGASPRRAVSPLQPLGHAQRNPTQPQSSMRVVSAPSGMNVQQNRDNSVTMTIGVPAEHKENVAPQPVVPMFKVSKVTGAQSNGIWTPGAGGMSSRPAPRPAPQRSPSPRFNVQQKWQPPPPSKLAAPTAPSPVQPEPTPMTFTVDLGQDVAITPSDFRTSQHETDGEPPLPVDIQKLMFGTHGRDSECSTPDSPATLARKKKIYADSSFYDDPEHKYPTIEEQIKMARSVALSLMAPQNKRARGHTMFMKRRQGASRWVAGVEPEPYDRVDAGPPAEESEKYYRPAPWKAGDQTWRPVGAPKPYMPPQQPQQQYQPPQQQMQQQPPQPAPEPYDRGWGQPDISARTWGRTAEPVYGQQQQQQPPPQQQLQPAPAYAPVRSPARGPVPPPASALAPASGKPFHTWQPPSRTAQPAQSQQPQEPPSWGRSATPTQQPAWEPPKAAWEPPKAAWEPPAPAAAAPPPAPPAPVAAPPPPAPPPPPPAPPLPDDSIKTMWRTPQLPSMKDKDKLNALSYDEFEKVRLLDTKNLHNQVSPQMCFSLANDLRNMKGKGGKLFAKRRARAEQWVVDEHPTNTGPDKNVMEKIAGQVAMEQARQNANLKTQPQLKSNDAAVTPKARLQEMIAKPAMTPWEAAAGGNIDAAFSHINKRNTIHGDNIVSGGWKNPTPPSAPGPAPATSLLALSGQAPSSSKPTSRNDYTRKIKGWSSVSGAAPAPSSIANVKPVSTPNFNAKQSYAAPDMLSPAQRPQHLNQERTPSPRLCVPSAPSPRQELTSPCYQTPPQRLSPQPQQAAMQPATNGEMFYDASELPAGCAEGEGYSDM